MTSEQSIVSMEQDGQDQYEISGELSFQSVPELCERIHDIIKDRNMITVNLDRVTRSDSAGVAMLVDWVRTAKEQDVDLHFHNIPEQMLSIARVSGLDTILPLD